MEREEHRRNFALEAGGILAADKSEFVSMLTMGGLQFGQSMGSGTKGS